MIAGEFTELLPYAYGRLSLCWKYYTHKSLKEKNKGWRILQLASPYHRSHVSATRSNQVH